MKRYGLIGYPLGHSFSERYFADKFVREGISGCCYEALPLENIGQLPALLREKPDLCGLNVTIPYKQQVIPLLDRIDPVAAEIGAVNCIRIDSGQLTGYNTDAYGFRRSLLQLFGTERPAALVLGTGGASKAVLYVLRSLGMNHTCVSRTGSPDAITYPELTAGVVAAHKLIVNCTPLGMAPDVVRLPAIPYEGIGSTHFLYDLIYNPPLTRFLELGAQHGAAIMNGDRMLVYQAEESWKIWSRP